MFKDVQDCVDAGAAALINTCGNADTSVPHAGKENTVGVELTFDMAKALGMADHVLGKGAVPPGDAHVAWFGSDTDGRFEVGQDHGQQLIIGKRGGFLITSMANRDSQQVDIAAQMRPLLHAV